MNKPSGNLGRTLRRRGFDETEYDRENGSYGVGCSQCSALVVNGVACHERGCPNARRGRRGRQGRDAGGEE